MLPCCKSDYHLPSQHFSIIFDFAHSVCSVNRVCKCDVMLRSNGVSVLNKPHEQYGSDTVILEVVMFRVCSRYLSIAVKYLV